MAHDENVYVALLRAVNVGGHGTVEMAKLKATFEQLGLREVRTYINSGNILFTSASNDEVKLTKQLETAIERDFGFNVPVLLRSRKDVSALVARIPADWVNDADTKCDVMFLRPEIDNPDVIQQLPYNPEIEEARYVKGSVLWRIDRKLYGKSRMTKIVGTKLFQQMTVRNPNTVRKIFALMQTY